jgi:Na+/glutamate symporter
MERLLIRILITIGFAYLLYVWISRYTSFIQPYFVFIIMMIVIGSHVWRYVRKRNLRKEERDQ